MQDHVNIVDVNELVKPPHPATHQQALELIHALTSNVDLVQARMLSSILKRNSGAEYLARFGLNMDELSEYGKMNDSELRQAFKSKLPVVTYEDLQSDIQRIANGDTSPILSSSPISEFLTSSGTSAGERKLMPSVHDEFERRCLLYSFLTPIMNQYVSGLDQGKSMYLYFIKSETKTPGGLLARPVLTSYYKSSWFTERPYDPYNVITSPNETILCADAYQSMYCQLLCGLLERHQVLRMGAVFASGFLRAINFLQNHWTEFCHDIRTATLNDFITDSDSRDAVQKLLDASGPNPTLADEIERICRSCADSGSWKCIIPMMWPRTKYIDVIVTGAMAQYIPTLDFYSGGLPLVCTMYGSSECYFGVNLKPLSKPSDVSYTLIPNMAYFELLPTENDGVDVSCDKLVDLVDAQVGKQYELVVTTYAGLYRYRVGDILRVTGFHNSAPQFQFVCRKNVALSIDSDKTDEDTLHRAIEIAIAKHINSYKDGSVRLMEYTSYADLSTIPGHYVLFWEMQGINHVIPNNNTITNTQDDSELRQILEGCCGTIEENLDAVYRQNRKSSKSIGPLEIRLVKAGTFDYLMDFSLSRGASINQYKAPRCVKSPVIIELMNARVVCRFSSPN